MAVIANSSGVVRGKFTIPANVSAGSKAVKFEGAGGSYGAASFYGQGTLVENVMQKVTRTSLTYYDPLAQTFYLDEIRQITGVDLYVEAKGTTPIVVHLRDTVNGYPGQNIIAEATLQPAEITAGQWCRWLFAQPTTVLPSTEYCIVVMCGDAVSSIGVAEMGKWSLASQRWVTSQSPNVGVLFSSSNNSTWTAHQDKDMSIRILGAAYTQSVREIDLGTVTATGHTDALVLATADTPTSGTSFELDLVLPDSRVIIAGDSQSVALLPTVTGAIGLRARIKSTGKVSSAIYPGTKLVLGKIATEGSYISRAFDADAADSRVKVTFDARLPSGSTVRTYLSSGDGTPSWVEVTLDGAARPLGDGIFEFNYVKEDFNQARCRVRLVLTGANAARPLVMNLRVSVT